ncbi:aminotransferase class V-fold PLP-dependent enzyme [Anaerobacillus alkaliphilus]|uniref:cysteine desulfurase n=1 Tax=Anaerobacillus alkaliphilus TaxID=1548597 RepID=A0A4Q0VWC5_9BACI|nr:aminotransferase class V-fold PLP-dependent enzyme [Anaerobacillus alkaliphilus]RXJ02835.1 aminotransferase class V-fold PLP-dependent enzyme [Anaerobacillus alkaliphilus]
MSIIYFDQAASSFPKPNTVANAVAKAINEYGANPGRGGHQLANRASEVIYETRAKLAKLFGEKDPNNVIFCQNATHALNQGIKGFPLEKGDHVISTSYEHNSVRRPLEYLKQEKGIKVTYLKSDINGHISKEDLIGEILPETKLVVTSHGSNLTGAIFPIEMIGSVCKERGISFLVDASQTAGILPIHMEQMNIDMLAFPGHKGLLGPQGTGVLIVNKSVELSPIFHGGTGSHSEQKDQPSERPNRYESGTLNTPGIAGLSAGVDEVVRIGVENIFEHEWELTQYCLEKMNKIDGVTVFGPDSSKKRLAVIPFVIDGTDIQEITMIFDQHYQVALRGGLHCAPLAHETIGTIEAGTIRASFGIYNTKEEIDQFINMIIEIKEGLVG